MENLYRLQEELNDLSIKKYDAVKNQEYELACKYRVQEREILEKIDKIKKDIGKQIHVRLDIEEKAQSSPQVFKEGEVFELRRCLLRVEKIENDRLVLKLISTS